MGEEVRTLERVWEPDIDDTVEAEWRLSVLAKWANYFSLNGVMFLPFLFFFVSMLLVTAGTNDSNRPGLAVGARFLCVFCSVFSLLGIGLGIRTWKFRQGKSAVLVGLISCLVLGLILAAP